VGAQEVVMATTTRDTWRAVAAGALAIACLLAACAPAGSPGPAAAPTSRTTAAAPASSPAVGSAWQGEWERTVAAARREGLVVVAGAPGQLYRQAMSRFEQAYPDVKLEYVGVSGRDFAPKVLAERRADQFLWDVHLGGPGTPINFLKPEGAFDSLKAAMILPDVLDDSKWFGGFDAGFLDAEGRYVFSFQAERSSQVLVNRDVIPASELSTIGQLADPRWSGKISWNDPRADGGGNGRVAFWLGAGGEDFVRRVLQQQAAITRDLRQQAEWLVRGQYPIAIGLGDTDLLPFQQQGVGTNVHALDPDSPIGSRMSSAFGNVMLMNRAPHPNAAKLYLNWLLSREGQTAWVEIAGRNSRRMDVPNNPAQTPQPGITYFDIDREENVHYRERAKEVAEEYIK
jgi:iron(III) transport system substrate-binding protein